MTPMNQIAVSADVLIPYQADLLVRTANQHDVAYVLDRAARWKHRVGFLPASALENAIGRGWVWISEIDGQRAGHTLITGGRRVPYVLRQNCVEQDLWGRGLGTVWTSIFLAYAKLTSPATIATVRTRHDIIEQTIINASTGGRPVAVDEPRKTARGCSVVTWAWMLSQRPRKAPRVVGNRTITTELVQPLLSGCKALPDGVITV